MIPAPRTEPAVTELTTTAVILNLCYQGPGKSAGYPFDLFLINNENKLTRRTAMPVLYDGEIKLLVRE